MHDPRPLWAFIAAIPLRLPLAFACDHTVPHQDWWFRGELRRKAASKISCWINQPAIRLYNWLWGKDGVWHDQEEIEHWPRWML